MPHEAISTFDIFKIGIGPSSSHTLGPWRAALRFIEELRSAGELLQVTSVRVLLYGSLAKTGKGHGTDVAVQLGLSGEDPVHFPVEELQTRLATIASMGRLLLGGSHETVFDPREDIEFLFAQNSQYNVFPRSTGAFFVFYSPRFPL